MVTPAYPAQQARSRKTLDRLTRATEEVLNRHGLEGATIPRIAEQAGLSPAAIYRRFPDKDALLRHVFLNFFQLKLEKFADYCVAPQAANADLETVVRNSVGSILQGYHERGGILRAMLQFLYQQPEGAFRRKMEESQAATFHALGKLLLLHRQEIRHPDPELAVNFGLLTVSLALRELVLMGGSKRWRRIVSVSDDEIAAQLTHILVNYLKTPPR